MRRAGAMIVKPLASSASSVAFSDSGTISSENRWRSETSAVSPVDPPPHGTNCVTSYGSHAGTTSIGRGTVVPLNGTSSSVLFGSMPRTCACTCSAYRSTGNTSVRVPRYVS